MDTYCNLARKAVENYVKKNNKIDAPEDSPSRLKKEKKGVFVTIKKNDDLRGCIGTVRPTQKNLGQEIIFHALAAATRDPRFSPVQTDELDQLSYTVHILSEPEQIETLSQLDPENYGLIVKSYPKGEDSHTLQSKKPSNKGLLLPGIEEIDTAHEQLDAVCKKAGINPQKEAIALFRFKTEKHEQTREDNAD